MEQVAIRYSTFAPAAAVDEELEKWIKDLRGQAPWLTSLMLPPPHLAFGNVNEMAIAEVAALLPSMVALTAVDWHMQGGMTAPLVQALLTSLHTRAAALRRVAIKASTLLPAESVQPLMELLARCMHMQSFTMDGVFNGSHITRMFCELVLPNWPCLEELHLRGYVHRSLPACGHEEADDVMLVAASLHHLPRLRSLDIMQGDHLSRPAALALLRAAAEHLLDLRVLRVRLSYSQAEDDQRLADVLYNALVRLPALEQLALTGRGVSTCMGEAVAKAVRHLPCLKHINMDGASIGGRTVASIIDALHSSCQPIAIDLHEVAISDKLFPHIASALGRVEAVRSFDSWTDEASSHAFEDLLRQLPGVGHAANPTGALLAAFGTVYSQCLEDGDIELDDESEDGFRDFGVASVLTSMVCQWATARQWARRSAGLWAYFARRQR